VRKDKMAGESCHFASRMPEVFFMPQRTIVQWPTNNGVMTNEQWCVFDLTGMVLCGLYKSLCLKKICGLLDAGITSLAFLQESSYDKMCHHLFFFLAL